MDRDLDRKSFLVTGANTGIGRATALELVRRGGKVWMACRSIEKAFPVVEAMRRETGANIELLVCDLGDLASVRACASDFTERAKGEPLDVLINNAGIAWSGGGLTKQGFELHFGVNYLGHFLLTQLLLGPLLASRCSRVVNVSSIAHYQAKGIDWDAVRRRTRGLVGRQEYCVSKLCNVLHAKELARRYDRKNLHAYALHPGVVASDIWRRVPKPLRWVLTRSMLSPEEGTRTTLYCATSPEAEHETGLYYDACRSKRPSALAEDPDLAQMLWERSDVWAAG